MLPHSPGPPASAPVECSVCLLLLMYSSVVGIIFTCDSIRYSVYITHICYCTIIVQCPHTCATPSRFLPFTLLLASGKMIGSCTLPIVSVSVYILRTLTNTARPFHKTLFSICYCSLKPSFVSPSLEASYRSTVRLQSHTSSSMFPLELQVVTPSHHETGGLRN